MIVKHMIIKNKHGENTNNFPSERLTCMMLLLDIERVITAKAEKNEKCITDLTDINYLFKMLLPSSAKPSHAAAGGSQISWVEISFIITAQPPTRPPTRGL